MKKQFSIILIALLSIALLCSYTPINKGIKSQNKIIKKEKYSLVIPKIGKLKTLRMMDYILEDRKTMILVVSIDKNSMLILTQVRRVSQILIAFYIG